MRGAGAGKYLNERGLAILGALDAVAATVGATPAQVALAWQIARPSITAPIASATTPAQLDELVARGAPELDAPSIELIDRVSTPMTRMSTHARGQTLSMTQVLVCGAAIVTLSMGIRHGFGLWLQPITTDRGWNRETFAFALAVQNLAWGLAGPFAGALADRCGAFRVLVVGSLLYAAGLVVHGPGDDRRRLPRQRRAADRHGAGGDDLRRSSTASSAATSRPSSAAGRWASPPRPARSASS